MNNLKSGLIDELQNVTPDKLKEAYDRGLSPIDSFSLEELDRTYRTYEGWVHTAIFQRDGRFFRLEYTPALNAKTKLDNVKEVKRVTKTVTVYTPIDRQHD